MQGPHGRRPRSRFNQADGKLREGEDPQAISLVGGQGGVHKHRHERISLVCLNVTRSQLVEDKKGKLWQDQP